MKQLTKLMLNDFNVLNVSEMKSVVGGATESGTTWVYGCTLRCDPQSTSSGQEVDDCSAETLNSCGSDANPVCVCG